MRPLFTLTLLFGFCSFAHGQPPCVLPEEAAEALDQPAALLALPSDQFFQHLETFSAAAHPPDELWPLLERCLQERTSERSEGDPETPEDDIDAAERAAWQREFACATLATELARQGTSSDHTALWSTFDDLRDDHPLRAAIVRGVLDSRLLDAAGQATAVTARAVAGEPDPLLPPVPRRASRFLDERPEPSWLTDAAPELREAWRAATAARRAYRRATFAFAGEEPTSFLSAEGTFFEAIADYLRGRVAPAESARRIGRFEWGSWCGTGADVFDEPRDRTLLLAFVDLGRPDLAAGALLDVARDRRGNLGVDWRGLAPRVGLDWEQLALGSFLAGDASAAAALAAHGSEQAARQLLAALTIPDPYADAGARLGDSDLAIASVAALVAPDGDCGDGPFHSVDVERKSPELPDGVQLEALAALAERVDAEAGLDAASEAARQLHRLCRVESLPVFEQMSRSPYAAVRELAAQALSELGAYAPATPPSAPVIFRVRIDGIPWQGPLHSTVLRADRSTSETRQPDAQGAVAFDRDPFVDRRAPVLAVRLSTPELAEEAGTWFLVQEPAPGSLDAPVDITVETRLVTLGLPLEHEGACADASCRLGLEAELTPEWLPSSEDAAAADYRHFESIAEERPLRAGVPWTARLAIGFRYRAVVTGAGGRWISPVVEPGREAVTVALRGDRLRPTNEWRDPEVANLLEP